MRKYFLFVIKGESYDIYKNKPESLYNTLYNLKSMKKSDYKMGLSIYNQLCNTFKPELLISYLTNKYHLQKRKNRYLLKNKHEYILILLKHSCTIIYSNVNIPSILNILYIYNKNIFVVDFDNSDYFWLTKETIK